jgi:uncharacterized protein YggE
MRTNKVLQFTLLGLILLLGACAPTAQPSQNATRILSVNGSASVTSAPDVAYVSIGVHSESEEAADAVAKNNSQVAAIVESLKALGVAEVDIQTSGFNIYPQDEWSPEGERTGTRFIVDNTVRVTVREIDAIGDILGKAVEAGANNIYGIQFDLEDKSELVAEARQQAVENAREQAEELAGAAGVSLGDIQSINYYSSVPAPIYDNKVAYGVGGAAMAESAAVPVSPGQLTISADVSLTFEIR